MKAVLLAAESVPRTVVVGKCRAGMIWGWNNLSGSEAQWGTLILVLDIWAISVSAVISWRGSRCEQ